MGDVAMTAPVLRQVKDKYPDLRIVMLTDKLYEPFFDGIDLTFFHADLHGAHKGIGGIRRLYRELRRQYRFDAVADLHDKLYSMLLDKFFTLGGIKVFKIDKGRADKKTLTKLRNKVKKQLRPMVLRYADVFARAGYPVEPDLALIRAERPAPAMAGEKNGPWIGLAPFAKHAGKILPMPTVREIVGSLRERFPAATVFIFGGGKDEKMVAEELQSEFPNSRSVVGLLGLRGELDLMANLDAMISMDSSAMHMSSIVGTPVVSVWGATHPYAGFLGFGQSEQNAVGTDIPCRPCSVYGNKPCYRGDYACLAEITAEQVAGKVASLLK